MTSKTIGAKSPAKQQEESAPTGRTRQRRPQEVRERVITAALHAFATVGFEGASTRSIAADAQVSHSLLIYHFQTKDDLWKAVVVNLAERFAISRVDEVVASGGASARDRLKRAIRKIVTMSAQYPELHRLMTIEAHQPSKRLTWMCENLIGEQFEFMRDLISEAQREGAVRRADPERLRFSIIGMAAVPFSVSAEYQYLTKRNPFSKIEIEQTIDLINALIFVD
ncbi:MULTISPECIES: TetR/AcrR family transcriptional regulator [Sphingobium]|uniref:TetR-family transcriptional regulator n=1 Tax=Sphingobium indicum (strain DSM 16413 / CCM 7287 / MTCC 6362 / UT26 / NBRC 101211 / UT26S) TaxID=452662 RepID=D4Z8G5_SPHIU|nr:TetR/AcrR family transcriptional regulator [Sphingobium indicum]BAI98784.1 TetR-family transcriptional regulator [Sphingobium indicum UT26S]